MIQTSSRKELYAIEVYNGMNVQRVHGSLLQHLKALNDGQPSKQFELEYGSRVLCILELESCKQHIIQRLQEDERFASAIDYFLFKTLDELQKDVFEGWTLFDGKTVGMF